MPILSLPERERAALSREKLSELVDVTPRFIADIEHGSVGVSVPTLKRICEVLKVSSDPLIWGKSVAVSIDDRLRLLDDDCIAIIDKTVQTQLELIDLIRNQK